MKTLGAEMWRLKFLMAKLLCHATLLCYSEKKRLATLVTDQHLVTIYHTYSSIG